MFDMHFFQSLNVSITAHVLCLIEQNLKGKNKNLLITHHLAQLDNTSASILVSSNSLDNCGPGFFSDLFLHLQRRVNQ